MSSTNVNTNAEDGYINNATTVFNTGANVESSTSSSSNADINIAYFPFDTADGSTSIPAAAIIDSVVFNWYVNTISNNSVEQWDVFFYPSAIYGTTLDTGDWDVVTSNPVSTIFSGAGTGWTFANCGSSINRSGYSWVRILCSAGSLPGGSMLIDSYENGSGRKAYLAVTWHTPSGAPQMTLVGVGM